MSGQALPATALQNLRQRKRLRIRTRADRILASMKFLEIDEMLCMLPASVQAEAMAEQRLRPIFERVAGDSQRLQRLTASGYLRSAEVRLEGRASAVFWWRVEAERLIVDTIVSIATTKETLGRACEAFKAVAEANGCKTIEGCTARAGVAQELIGMDWYPVGIVLRKDI